MALTLALVFRARLRLLPLVVALAAAALTFGGLSLVGASLTMASIGVLPVLIGLAVDYAIQLQSRVEEARGGRGEPRSPRRPSTARGAARRRSRPRRPATAAGFLVLALSPVPMVRGFGLLLVAGIAVALAMRARRSGSRRWRGRAGGAARRGAPAPARRARGRRGGRDRGPPGAARASCCAATALARALLRGGRAARGRGCARRRRHRPGRVARVGPWSPSLGWALDTQTHGRVRHHRSSSRRTCRALQDLSALQKATGVGGEIDVVVRSDEAHRRRRS